MAVVFVLLLHRGDYATCLIMAGYISSHLHEVHIHLDSRPSPPPLFTYLDCTMIVLRFRRGYTKNHVIPLGFNSN